MDVNPKGYEVSQYITTKVKVNTWMISTSKDEKSNLSMNSGGGLYINDQTYGDFSYLVQKKILHGLTSKGYLI